MEDKLSFIKKIISSYYVVKAKDLLSKKNDIDALYYLNKASKIETKYDIYIYKALAEFLLNKYENALLSYQYALKLIEQDKNLNLDEREYLKKFVVEDILSILTILNKRDNYNEYLTIFKNITFNKDNIRTKFFKDFPINNEKK